MSMSVCVSVCPLTTWKWCWPNSCMLPVAMPQSSSDSVAICYVLLVLRMILCFHTMGSMGRNPILWSGWQAVPVLGLSLSQCRHYSVWLSLSECGTRDEVFYLKIALFVLFLVRWFYFLFYLVNSFICQLSNKYDVASVSNALRW